MLLCYSCYSCDIYLGVFFLLQWNFLSLICDFFRLFLDFCKPEFLLNIIMFAKIATKICKESFATGCNPYWICYFCYTYSLFYTFVTVRFFFFFFAKIGKTICYQIFSWWNWYIIQLALSGKRGSSSSLPNSSANWLKKMLALVYNIINQLCSAIIHWVGATTCNVRSLRWICGCLFRNSNF